MSDLLERARPIRDAAVAETLRVLNPEASAAERAGGVLAAHLGAVLIAWGCDRNTVTHGSIRDPDLLDALGYGLGLLLGNAGSSFRPTVNGTPLSQTQSVSHMIHRAAEVAIKLAIAIEQGTIEVSLPIERQADGSLGPQRFDVMAMLGAKR